MNKSPLVFAAALLALAMPSFATEATDNALFKGRNPLGEAMGKPVYANRVFQQGCHCWCPSLIKVTPQYNPDGSIKRYVLYFINVRKGAIAGTSWLYSDDLSPGSWYGHHSELVQEAKFNNPAIIFYPNNRGSVNQLPGDVDHEDACLWEVNGQYHALMTDMSGRATGGKKKAVMHWFADAKSGTNYRLYSDLPLAYVGDSITFAEGNTERYYRMERPQVYVNPETDKVEAFLLACNPREGSQSAPTEGASIIIWPVNHWKPEK